MTDSKDKKTSKGRKRLKTYSRRGRTTQKEIRRTKKTRPFRI